MRKGFMLVLFFLAALIYPFSLNSQEKRPLNLGNIKEFLKSDVFSSRAIVKLIRERGLDFVTDDNVFSSLRAWGANEAVIDAVREESEKNLGSLYVESDPPGAGVILDDRAFDGVTPLSIKKIVPGEKRLVVSGLSGYGKYEGTVVIEMRMVTTVRVQLPQFFSMTIRTVPSDAQVFLAGNQYKNEKVGETKSYSPLVISNLPAGSYTIEIKKPGYKIKREMIIMDQNQVLEYILEPETHRLVVKTNPPQADISIEKTFIKGQSPISVDLPQGSYTIIIVKTGYKNIQKTIFLNSDKTFEFPLEQEEYYLYVETDPSKAKVYLDDEKAPKGDSTIRFEITPGNHKIIAKKSGYEDAAAEVLIQDPEQQISITLKQKKPGDQLAVCARGLIGMPYRYEDEENPEYAYWLDKAEEKVWLGSEVNVMLRLLFLRLEFGALSRFHADITLPPESGDERNIVGSLDVTPYIAGIVFGRARRSYNDNFLYFSIGATYLQTKNFSVREHMITEMWPYYRVMNMEAVPQYGVYFGLGSDFFITKHIAYNFDLRYLYSKWTTKTVTEESGAIEGHPFKIRFFLFQTGFKFYLF